MDQTVTFSVYATTLLKLVNFAGIPVHLPTNPGLSESATDEGIGLRAVQVERAARTEARQYGLPGHRQAFGGESCLRGKTCVYFSLYC